jgi:hypothetical protein
LEEQVATKGVLLSLLRKAQQSGSWTIRLGGTHMEKHLLLTVADDVRSIFEAEFIGSFFNLTVKSSKEFKQPL